MRKLTIMLGSLLIGGITYAQQNPTGNPPINPNSVGQTARSAWYRGGNQPFGQAVTNNIFGTKWNSPIYTETNGQMRSILNGTRFMTIDGYPANNTSGFMGLGANSVSTTEFSGPLWESVGPFSLLHLNADDGTQVQSWAYRPWMGGGMSITYKENTSKS